MSKKEGLQYPHCEFPLLSNEQISSFIGDKLSSRESASLIRLGDGEGAILARPTPKNTTLWSTVLSHFGPYVTPEFINSLADELTNAIIQLGLEFFSRQFMPGLFRYVRPRVKSMKPIRCRDASHLAFKHYLPQQSEKP